MRNITSASQDKSIRLLKEAGIEFESRDFGKHLVVCGFDFYPALGLFIHQESKKRGHGVFKLIESIKEKK